MNKTHITFLVLLCFTTIAQQVPPVPFPGAGHSPIDPALAALVRYRIDQHNDGSAAEKKIVAMGAKAVPTLIEMAKLAANKDPLVLRKDGVQDYDWDLIRPIQMLVQIGDRRAISLISALVKYDDPKPRRMAHSLEVLLCRGSDQQILLDAQSEDPNVARAAKKILNNPGQFEQYKQLYRKTK